MERARAQHRAGFTLIEALLAATILAMGVAAITMPFTVGAQNEQVDARHTMALCLAQEMMEEILSRPFNDPDGGDRTPGPEPGETPRSGFDNIDDYHGYTEAAGNVRSRDGRLLTDAAVANLSRRVTVAYVYVQGQDVRQAPTFVRVTVEVLYRNRPTVTLTRLACELRG